MRARLGLLVLAACGSHAEAPRPAATASAAVTVAPTPPPPRKPTFSTAWIEDDYPRALAEAKKADVPLFVDASAVWCHTCKAMRAYVLDDPALPHEMVRLSFDVEKDQNAAAAAAFPAHVLPSFFVVDPRDGAVHGRWEGAASVRQMRTFLTDAARSIALARDQKLDPSDPLAILLSAQRASMQKKFADAAAAYARALAAAPKGWDHEAEAMLGLLEAQSRDPAACIVTAERGLDRGLAIFGPTSVLADFASDALDCVEKGTDARSKHVRELVAKDVAALAADPNATLSPDDRADAWKIVWDAREALGDHAGALEAARARLAVILAVVAAHPEPELTTTYDGARMETLEFLGRGAEAAQFLEAQEKALPDDYNPPHRLAHVYFKLKKYPQALAAIDRAIGKGYGARKGLMLRLKSDILLAMGKKREAIAALRAQLALYRALAEGQRKPGYEKTVEDQIAKLESSR